MGLLNVHSPDPDSPKGMAWVLGVGMVDPRPGNPPNQIMAMTQSWEPTSELWWELGLRWHPELATKWVSKPGAQFTVAELSNEKPEHPEPTLEDAAEEVLEFLATEHPEYAETLRRIHSAGSDEERAKLVKQYEVEVKRLLVLSKYIQG